MEFEFASRLFPMIDAGRFPQSCFFACTDAAYADALTRACAARLCGVSEEALEKYPNWFDFPMPPLAEPFRELLSELLSRGVPEAERCVRFCKAELMNASVQNIFLKTLEEPPPHLTFLLSGSLAGVLPTIRSRCVIFRPGVMQPEEMRAALLAQGVSSQDAALYSGVADSYTQALRLCNDPALRALREDAFSAFMQLLKGTPPYDFCKTVKGDRAMATDVALFWSGYAEDMLRCKTEGTPRCADKRRELTACAQRFTIARINCMIEMLSSTLTRLRATSSAAATLDSLATRILEGTVETI